ncbi:MAG TPA: glycosyltransferase family 4 protein [bacterium]|jgi:glycosyltransferase involved in cell wall biosynthesis
MSLKLLHLLTSPHLGGAEQVCLSLAAEQQRRGHDVRLLVLMPGKVQQTAARMGLPVISPELPDGAVIGKHQFRARAAESLRRAAKEFTPNLVHSHVPLGNLLCSRVLPPIKLPWVTTAHGSYKQFAYAPVTVAKPYLKPYLLLRHAFGDWVTLRSAARVVTVSEYARQELLSIGLPAAKIRTVLNGLPRPANIMDRSAARATLGVAADAMLVGALGYFAPVKGFDILVRAFAVLQDNYPALQLWIAGGDVLGDTSVRRSLQALITALCPGGRVRLLDTLDPKAGFLSALDLFVISSRTEGLPLSLVEAMQHGKASVVSSAGGSAEAARPGLEGLVFESEDPQSLAAQIDVLLRDPALRESLGRAAQARAFEYLTLKRCAADYDAVYTEVCSSSI